MFEEVRKQLANQFHVAPETITTETRISEDLHADSLDVMQLLMAMEDEFGIVIPDEDILTFKTVADIVAYIESKK